MTIPNLDATWHHWVESLVRFTFSIEYQKGQENAAADALSQITLKLDTGTMKSILDIVTMGMTERADAHNPAMAKADDAIPKQVWETAILARVTQVHVNYMWLIGWPPNRRIQYWRPQLSGSLTRKYRIWGTCWEMAQILRRENLSFKGRRSDTLPRSPLPSPHTNWWVGRSFAVHSPHASSHSCLEWMSLRCWTPESEVNSVLATWPVLVA